jgi:MbtH protein
MDAFSHFQPVVNAEEQYSIWPTELELPAGWRAVGAAGSKDECLRYIESVWTDIRPLSLRQSLAARRAATAAGGRQEHAQRDS